jgi:2-polyprenyl-3-methyl-5-hydroxy-6-metoxy-1,4-benzoquinol methylase
MTCAICQNDDGNIPYIVEERMFGTAEKFNYFECCNCGCLQIKDKIEDLSKYYPENYYSFNLNNSNAEEQGLKSKVINIRDRYALTKEGLMGKILTKIWPAENLLNVLSHLKISKKTKILDVGSGDGAKLMALANLGYSVKGIDPFIKATKSYKNGLVIEKKEINDIDEKFDLITLNHVFEHLLTPFELLEKLNSLLNTGGYCIIRTPTTSSFAWKHYGVYWVQIDAPRHIFINSVKSIELIAKKTHFNLTKVLYDSSCFQFMGSELYQKEISFVNGDFSEKNNKYFSDDEIKGFKEKAIQLNIENQGDQAAFFLRKE